MYKKTIVTPIGILKYPRLRKPDTKFNPDGDFKANLIIEDNEEGLSFLEKVQGMHDEYVEQVKAEKKKKKVKEAALPVVMEEDKEGEETGKVEVKSKQKAKIKMQEGTIIDVSIPIVDSKKRVLPAEVNPFGGTKAKLSLEFVGYDVAATGVGLSCRLKAVQVLELVEGSGGDAASAFDVVDDGYEAPETASEAEDEGEDEEEDF